MCYLFFLLSSNVSIGLGVLWCVLLFLFCFSCVHLLRFIKNDKTNADPKPQPQNNEEKSVEKEKQTPQNREPVYYIVERKRRGGKTRYDEPREFRFK